MIRYKFPIIETIDDVLPHIFMYPEFVVKNKGDYIVINYNFETPHCFDMIDENDTAGAIRRECRGLIFDPNGKLISRPFHKFFNVGQRAETAMSEVDIYREHTIYEKMDGSMIRPFMVNSEVRLGTKMGVTDVGEQCEEWFDSVSTVGQRTWIKDMLELGRTPLFEFVSPENNIVVHYDEPDLVLLALRDNRTGVYVDLPGAPFSVPAQTHIVEGVDLHEWIAVTNTDQDREGDIIRFADGHMVKIKNEWYSDLHRIKSDINSDRHVVRNALEGKMDDIYPKLDEKTAARVREVEERFWKAFFRKRDIIKGRIDDLHAKFGNDRKRIALEGLPQYPKDVTKHFIFGFVDGRNVDDMMFENALKNLSSDTNYTTYLEWLEE